MDIITYIPDLALFRIEAAELGILLVDGDNISYPVSKVPVKYNSDGKQSVCLIRLNNEELQQFNTINSIERLGVCVNKEYVFDSDDKRIIHESVYDTTTRILNGKEYTPPYSVFV